MFKALRKNIKSIIWALVIAFVLWGAGTAITSRMVSKDYAGKVFSKKVTYDKYLQGYRAVQNQARMRYGDNYQRVSKFLNLEDEAWERIILLYEARRRRIRVSKKELSARIASFPFFQKDGAFDYTLYTRILRYAFQLEPYQFETEIRDTMKLEKLIDTITGGVSISEEELAGEYRKENEEVRVTFILTDPAQLADEVTIDDGELSEYYERNMKKFEKGEQAKIEYVEFPFKDFEADVHITDDDIKKYYDAHKENFKTGGKEKEEIRYEPLDEVRDDINKRLRAKRLKELAREKADEFLDELIENEDMQSTARKFGKGPKETGYFTRQEKIPGIGWSFQVSNAAFELDKGGISEVITSSDACYVIKLIGKLPPYVPPFEEVKAEVKKRLAEEKSWGLAKEKAEDALKKLNELTAGDGSRFEEAAGELGLKAEKTSLFKKGQYVPGIGTGDEFFKLAFDTPAGEISQAAKAQKGYVIFRVDEHTAVDKDKFEKEKKDFRAKLISRRKSETFQQWFDELKKRANLKIYLEKGK